MVRKMEKSLSLLIVCAVTVLCGLTRCDYENYPYYIKSAVPDDVAFSVIIDGSGSMGSILPDVKNALHSLAEVMKKEDFMQIIVTGTTPSTHQEWTNDADEIDASIDSISIPGGDDELYHEAVEYALEKSLDDKLQCVLLIGDGEIYYSSQPGETTVITSIKESTAQYQSGLFTFGFGSVNVDVLTDIAGAGDGEFYPVGNPEEFAEYYLLIKERVQEGYVVEDN